MTTTMTTKQIAKTLRSLRLRQQMPRARYYATTSSIDPPSQLNIFDRKVKRLHRDLAAHDVETSRQVDYLRDHVAENVADRLLDIKRKYSTVVDLGSGAGHIIKHVDKDMVDKMIMCEFSETLLHRDKDEEYEVPVERRVVDEENLPFEEGTLEAVLSSMSLHWVNDLPGTLIQIRKALKPDAPLIAAMIGGDSLYELRTSLQLAELEREGGISPRVSPMTDVRDISALLGRTGYALTTIDIDEVVINYPSIFELMDDLKAMGDSNAVLTRRHNLHRDTLLAASSIYKEYHGNEDGTIPATFQIIYFIGWKPDPSQPKPLPRGSGQKSLKDELGADQ